MIIWCTNCNSFIAEEAPYEKLEILPRLCISCKGNNVIEGKYLPHMAGGQVIINKTLNAIKNHESIDLKNVMKVSAARSFARIDILLGILQPLLEEIGRLFEAGLIESAEEHEFTAQVEQILFEMRTQFNRKGRNHMLIYGLEGNRHLVGATMFATALDELGFQTTVLEPAYGTATFFQKINELKPKIVGLSAALPKQLRQAPLLGMQLRENFPKVKLALGGYALKTVEKTGSFKQVFDFINNSANVKETISEVGAYLAQA